MVFVKESSYCRTYLLCIDDLIAQLKQSGHGIYIEQLFVGCVCYADDIALLCASCYGLQKNYSVSQKTGPLKLI